MHTSYKHISTVDKYPVIPCHTSEWKTQVQIPGLERQTDNRDAIKKERKKNLIITLLKAKGAYKKVTSNVGHSVCVCVCFFLK